MRTLILMLVSVAGMAAFGFTPYKRALTAKGDHYILEGVVTGGKASIGMSLLNVHRGYLKDAGIERVVVALGDNEGKPTGRAIGYYQVSVDPQNKRVVLDLSQLKLSLLTEVQLKKLFKNSPFVASTELTLDPEDKAASLVLHLKKPVRAEVFELLKDKQPSRVVIDLKSVKS